MLSDVLFLLIAVTIILKILSSIKYASIPILLIAGSLSFIEAFVTVDKKTGARPLYQSGRFWNV